MILKFMTVTIDPSTKKKTYWFDIRLPQYRWTSFSVGFSDGKWTSASKTFYELDKELQDSIIEEVSQMLPKVVD